MQTNRLLFTALSLVAGFALLVCASTAVWAASDWVTRIGKVIPANITLTEVKEEPKYVQLEGQANANSDISALMRAIDQADLGSPQLQKIQRKDGISNFVLRVTRPR